MSDDASILAQSPSHDRPEARIILHPAFLARFEALGANIDALDPRVAALLDARQRRLREARPG